MKAALVIALILFLMPLGSYGQWNPSLRDQLNQEQGSDEKVSEEAPQAEPADTTDVQADEPVPEEAGDTLNEPAEQEPEAVDEEDAYDEEVDEQPPRPVAGGPIDEEEERDVEGPKKITIDTVIYVDYQFFGSPDAFKIKYHINMGGQANLTTSVIKGNSEIATEVTGFLAKWATGQCLLDVKVEKIPYEITYNKSADNEADINVEFKKDIDEIWESKCTFLGSSGKPLVSQGPPERWISSAIEKAIPPLSSIVAPVDAAGTTSTTFDIIEYEVVEESLGSAKVKGTGLVTIEPFKKPAVNPATAKPPSNNEGSY